MPKQPTSEDLGGTPGIDGARPVGSYDVGEYARGAQKMAQAGEHLGASVVRFGEAVDQVERRRLATEWTDQSAATYGRLIDLRSRLRNDPNYATLEQRWQDGAHAIIDDGAAGISHPGLRDRFQIAMGLHVAKEGEAIREQAFRGAAGAHAASRDGLLQNLERHSSLDPDDTLYAGGIDSYHAAIDADVARGYLAPDAALAEKRNGALRLGIAHYGLMARVDPDRVISELQSEDGPNPNVRYFPAAVKTALLAQALGNQHARQVDAERSAMLKDQERQRASDQEETRIVTDLIGERPTITTEDIVNNETLTLAAKPYIVAVADRAAKPDPPATISNVTARQLLDRVRLADGDPAKIKNLTPIYAAYVHSRLGKDDLNFVRKEFSQKQTPDGETLLARKQAFLKTVEPLIDLSDTTVDKIDQNGRTQMYLLERDLDQKIDQLRKDGRNPVDLFDPSKPDFVGSSKALLPYTQDALWKSLQDQLQELIAAARLSAHDAQRNASTDELIGAREALRAGVEPRAIIDRFKASHIDFSAL
jgi:hypothetical protein